MNLSYADENIQQEIFTFPLSFAQERLWFLNQLDANSAAYNIPRAFKLTGPLNAAILKASLNKIIERHEIFRTTFATIDEQLVQVISPVQNLNLEMIDLQALTASQKESQIKQLVREKAFQPFNLATGPLLRVTLWQLGSQDYILLFTTHHIVFDDWSLGIFLEELTTIYGAYATKSKPPLPELSIQYADFAHWQQERLQGEALDTQMAYWKNQLAGAPPALVLAAHSSEQLAPQGKFHTVMLPAALTESLKTIAFDEQSTLFMVLLAAFNILLQKYTKQNDLVVASPIANRTQVETEVLIGRFTNLLLLRSNLSGNPTFREFLSRVRKVAFEAYDHQDVPFEKLLMEWDENSPLVPQVMFQLRNSPKNPFRLPNLEIAEFKLDSGIEKFDLTLEVTEKTNGLLCLFRYKAALFEATIIEQMAADFQTLLERIVTNPEQPLSSLLPSTETTISTNGNNFQKAKKTQNTIVPPQNAQEYQLLSIWKSVLGIHAISVTDNFFELGGHSLLGMQLLTQLEKSTGQKLPVATLFQAPTIEKMARVLSGDEDIEATSSTSLVAIQAGGSKPPFFCLPGNLGNVFTDLGDLARSMGPDQPFYSFQDGLKNPTGVKAIATRYLDEIQTIQPEGPYFLGGICWGSTVAFEMAHQLQAGGQQLALLALIEPSEWSAAGLQPYINFAADTIGRVFQRFTHHSRSMSKLNPIEQKDYTRLKAKVVANRWAILRYTPQLYQGRIELFLTDESLNTVSNPQLGWHKLIAAQVEVHKIPGTHNTITGKSDTPIEKKHMQILAERLNHCINKAIRQF